MEQDLFEIFLKWETLIYSYMKFRCEQHCTTTWIEFRINSIQFKFNQRQNKMQIGGENIQNLLVNRMLKTNLN